MSFVRLIVENADAPTLVNADCRTNILLDHCKNSLLGATIEQLEARVSEARTNIQIVESKIRLNDAANAAPADSGEPPTEGDAGAGATPEKEELAQWQAYLGTLQKALSTFRNDELVVDFANTEDGGACANLKTVMELPAKDTLNVRGTYNLICNLVDEEPVSVIDLCGASLAMSPADDKENAAKEAAATAAATAAAEAAGSAE